MSRSFKKPYISYANGNMQKWKRSVRKKLRTKIHNLLRKGKILVNPEEIDSNLLEDKYGDLWTSPCDGSKKLVDKNDEWHDKAIRK